jgi:adenylosuccinate lyase
MRAWEDKASFRKIVEADSDVATLLSKADIEDAFDARYHVRHVDLIFDRVGL